MKQFILKYAGLALLFFAMSFGLVNGCSQGISISPKFLPSDTGVTSIPEDPKGIDPTGNAENGPPVPRRNPDGSTSVLYPTNSSLATMAFEDLYPNPGDADYNDFICNFQIDERYNSNNELAQIIIKYVFRHLGANFSHDLKFSAHGSLGGTQLVIDELFKGTGTLNLKVWDKNKNLITDQAFSKDQDVTIFADSQSLLTKYDINTAFPTAELTINLDSPEQNKVSALANVNIAKYRMALYVRNTQQTIDLVTVNTSVSDSKGYPFGLVVPTDWKAPVEGQNIDPAYPYFKAYRDWLASGRTSGISLESLQWYNHLAPNADSKVFLPPSP